jgi:acetyltransferase
MADGRPPLRRLFNPKSIAVVGASGTPGKAGYRAVEAFTGFAGPIYPINPKVPEILGRQAYARLGDTPNPPDLAILAIPAAASVAAVAEAAEIGVGGVIVVSGGFAESGAEGERLQRALVEICRSGGPRILGPNTSGFVNPAAGVCATFVPDVEAIRPGAVGLAAQSGGINLSLAFMLHNEGIGVRLAVGLGNGIDVGLPDLVEYFAADEDCRVIALHLEGVADGRAMFEAISKAARAKPIVALPVGRAEVGEFARSHTGNLMGSQALTRAALAQAGAVVVETTLDLIDAVHALGRCRLGPKRHVSAAIVTGQAGPGLLIADTLRAAGVALAKLEEATVSGIAALLPPLTYIRNPVDTGRPGPSFGAVLEAVLADRAVDAAVVFGINEPDALDPLAVLASARGKHPAKPLLFGTAGLARVVASVMAELEVIGVPCFPAADRAARALLALVADAKNIALGNDDVGVTSDFEPPRLPPGTLDEAVAKEVINRAGLPTPLVAVCESRDAAREAFDFFGAAFGGPLAVKLLDAEIQHKTELGGVVLGVKSLASLKRALDRIDGIPTGRPKRYLLEEMAPPGLDLILGARNAPSFGPTVLVGLGSIAAEALGDVQVRVAPLGIAQALDMLDGLKGKALLDGFRGTPVVDRAKIADAIVRLGALIASAPEIREIDLNPVRAYADRILVLDALILRAENAT